MELLEEMDLEAHLAHPAVCKAIAFARLRNDRVDARTHAQLFRADLLPEAWIASRPVPDQSSVCSFGAGRRSFA